MTDIWPWTSAFDIIMNCTRWNVVFTNLALKPANAENWIYYSILFFTWRKNSIFSLIELRSSQLAPWSDRAKNRGFSPDLEIVFVLSICKNSFFRVLINLFYKCIWSGGVKKNPKLCFLQLTFHRWRNFTWRVISFLQDCEKIGVNKTNKTN